MQTTTTKAKTQAMNLMEYIHEDRDLLMGLQDDLSDMLYLVDTLSLYEYRIICHTFLYI